MIFIKNCQLATHFIHTINNFEMGNSEPLNSKLRVYIETEKPFYNSGSVINGAVFVEAYDNFQFDALYIRVEGNTIIM